MGDSEVHEVTPRPLRVVNQAPIRVVDPVESLERAPYIPRRKSSVGDRYSIRPDTPLSGISRRTPPNNTIGHSTTCQPSSAVTKGGELIVQRARFPIDGYDPLPYPLSRMDALQARRPLSAAPPSSGRRMLKCLTSLMSTSNQSRRPSNSVKSSDSWGGPSRRLSKSSAAPSSSRTSSASSSATCLRGNTVRQNRVSVSVSPIPETDSPNPLRAPPPLLLGPVNHNLPSHSGSRTASSISAFSAATQDQLAIPTLTYAKLRVNILQTQPSTRSSKDDAAVWFIVDVSCDLHSAKEFDTTFSNSGESFRNLFLNDVGYLQNLTIDLMPAPGCQMLATIGKLSRQCLGDGETWTVIVQLSLRSLLHSRRKGFKSFSLQNRPASSVLIDHIQNMLKPLQRAANNPEVLELITGRVRYQHSMLPPEVECRSESKCANNLSVRDVHRRRTTNAEGAWANNHNRSARQTSHSLLDDDQDWMAEGLLRVLEEESEATNTSTSSSLQAGGVSIALKASDAIKLINDFIRGQDVISPRIAMRLDHLRTRYGNLVLTARSCSSMTSEYATKIPASPANRRNAFEIDRVREDELGNADEFSLRSITNRGVERYRGYDKLGHSYRSTITKTLQENVPEKPSTSISKTYKRASPLRHTEPIVPEPLFTPRRNPAGPGNVRLLNPRYQFNVDGACDVGYEGTIERGLVSEDIGTSKFYEQEVRATKELTLDQSPYKPPRSEWNQVREYRGHEKDEEGFADARKIWDGIDEWRSRNRLDKEEDQLEKERVREMQVLGAPWLC